MVGTRLVGFAPRLGGKVMEASTHNTAGHTLQAIGTCADGRLGQGGPTRFAYHRREPR
jgi:hypothetical protein